MSENSGIGYGSDLLRGNVPVGEILNISGPSLSRDVVDKTHMKSPQRYRQFLSGLRDAGEFSVEMQSLPHTTEYQQLVADFNNDDPEAYSIVFPDGTKWTVSAFLTKLETDDPLAEKIVSNVTFKIDGIPVLTVAT